MKCPHCLHAVHINFNANIILEDEVLRWVAEASHCPACDQPIIYISSYFLYTQETNDRLLAYPRGISRSPLPAEVPPEFAGDYNEACRVLADSPKASAALSRRCLQHLLREKASATQHNLIDQISHVMPSLPSHLAEMIDSVRVMGNFAAHPMKSTNTGEVLDVEPGEAEWLLDTLEELFDHYLVKPALIQQKRTAINGKLAQAGKPPMK